MPEDTSVSTYCLVATCKAVVGSCVTAIEVRPPKVRFVAPKAVEVVPSVIDELVRLAFPMLDSVLLDPLMVLFVRVCVPVRVATVESMAMVTAVEPL